MVGYSNRYCSDCDIWVHDAETLKNHMIGKPHLKQLQRLQQDSARKAMPNYGSSNTKTGLSYYELPSQFNDRVNEFHKQHGTSNQKHNSNGGSEEERGKNNNGSGRNRNYGRSDSDEDFRRNKFDKQSRSRSSSRSRSRSRSERRYGKRLSNGSSDESKSQRSNSGHSDEKYKNNHDEESYRRRREERSRSRSFSRLRRKDSYDDKNKHDKRRSSDSLERKNRKRDDYYHRDRRHRNSSEDDGNFKRNERSPSRSRRHGSEDELKRGRNEDRYRTEEDSYSRIHENNNDYTSKDNERFGTSSSAYPVIPSAPRNNEFRPKVEFEIKKVNGQFYCEPCDTYCARMDTMQSHIAGQKHVKKTKQITRYTCDLCLIEVSSAETLQTHYLGMSHMKRAKVAEEAKKEAEYPVHDSLDPMEELADLRKRCQKLERQNVNLQKQVDNLLHYKADCIENHTKVYKTENVTKSEYSYYDGVVLK